MPALPTNADRTNGAATVSVARRSRPSRSTVSPVPSAVVMAARNVLWAQCSLHVWASVSSSTSVGSRPTAVKWSRMTASSSGSRASDRAAPRRARPASSRSRTATTSTSRCVVGARVELGRRRGGRPALDDRVGDEAPHQDVGVGAGGHDDAPPGRRGGHGNAELRGGVDDGLGRAIGHTGVQRDLDAVGRGRPTSRSAAADRRGTPRGGGGRRRRAHPRRTPGRRPRSSRRGRCPGTTRRRRWRRLGGRRRGIAP